MEAYLLEAGRPAGLTLQRGATLTLVGRLRGGEGDGFVVVAVREVRGGEAVVWLALVEPTELAANGVEGVGKAGGYRVRGDALGNDGVLLPEIPLNDPLFAQLEAAMGVVFFDKAVGQNGQETFLANPIVPQPPTEPVP